MSEKKQLTKRIFNWTYLLLFLVGVILVNIIGSLLSVRLDMTEDQRYTLSDGTIKFLENDKQFDNRLNIKIYLDGNLPAELKYFAKRIFKSEIGRVNSNSMVPVLRSSAMERIVIAGIRIKKMIGERLKKGIKSASVPSKRLVL